MSFGVTLEGFNRKRQADSKSEIEALLKSKLGASINLIAPSVISQLVGIFSERDALIWEVLEDIYGASYPDTAEGVSLDNVVRINSVTRLAAIKSTLIDDDAPLLFGTAGTSVPSGTVFSVDGNPEARFETIEDVVLAAGTNAVQLLTFSGSPTSGSFRLNYDGESTDLIPFNATVQAVEDALNDLDSLSGVDVTGTFGTVLTVTFAGDDGKQPQTLLVVEDETFNGALTLTPSHSVVGVVQAQVDVEAEEEGPTQAVAGTLTVIETPVSGLDRVLNKSDATVGRGVETDNELRLRREDSLQVAGAATIDAIRSRIRNLEGVTSVLVVENDTDAVDGSGRPEHSFEVIVAGGDDQEIADEIFAAKAVGVKTYGTETETVVDDQGFSHTVKFSRFTAVPIFIEIDLETDDDYPVDGDDQVKAALAARGNESFEGGSNVVVYPTLVGVLDEIPGITDFEIRVGTALNPTLDNNVTISVGQTATFDVDDIEVAPL